MKTILLSLMIVVSVQFSIAQISLSYDDVLDLIGNQNLMRSDTTGDVAVNVGSAGGNQTWDFSNQTLPNGYELTFTFKDPSGSPYVDFFPTATFLMEEEFSGEESHIFGYSYYFLDQSSFDFLGFAFTDTVSGYEVLEMEENPEDVNLPLNYGDSWTEVSYDTMDFGFGSLMIGYDSTVTVIDAWGTIITPAGTFECLRLRDSHYSTDSVYFQGTALYGFGEQNIGYEWIGRDAMIFAMVQSQNGETNPEFTTAQAFTVVQETGPAGINNDAHPNIISGFDLAQNYPNPFNPSTTISYSIPKTSNVEVAIYNSSGQMLLTLVNTNHAPGDYQVTWDAAEFASGVYLYKIKAGTFVQSKKMLLIR